MNEPTKPVINADDLAIYMAIAAYREQDLDLTGLLDTVEAARPGITVAKLQLYIDQYFEKGGQ